MADITVHKKEFAVRELAAQVITLYPTRAHVVRSIRDLSLGPGSNEITIHGITPTADESSIKVEGTGAATITDMTIDLVDNLEHFEDFYPSDSEVSEASESDGLSDSDVELQAVKELTSKIRALEGSIKEATEERNSAQGRLKMLENYAQSLTASRPDNITACVEAYESVRARAFKSHQSGESKLGEHEEEIKKLKKQRRKLLEKEQKKKIKANQAKSKDEKKKKRARQQKMDEKYRLKQERIRFWPKKVYKVVLSLDANSGMTPTSSRRGSLDSIPKTPAASRANGQGKAHGETADASKIDLSFSYITHSASWSPRYDLALDTSAKSGSITYRAEFRNTTSETWRETKVVLTTSQTSFQGLGEAIPQIQPWHIRLAKGSGEHATDDALLSHSEQARNNYSRGVLLGPKLQAPRSQLFGNSSAANPFSSIGASTTQPSIFANSGSSKNNLFGNLGSSNAAPAESRGFGSSGGSGLFGATQSRSLFGTSNNNQSQPAAPASTDGSRSFGGLQAQTNIALPVQQQTALPVADEEETDLDTETIVPADAALAFEESTWEESGLTTAYTVPGLKTIAPSHTTRRHKVASIPLSSITLSHIIVPKLRTAAFLKARLRNTSSTTLLKGPVGLTLDGTFLGNTTLPRSSPGEAFVLNLGVDPALNVVYGKPSVRRSQSGVFQKEGSRVYTRSCTLTNTKNNTVVEATVLDQVPVSDDEKLRLDVLVPRGLRKDDDQVVVKAGVGQINEGTGKKGSTYAENSSTGGAGEEKVKWGKASAKMKKEGEIEWDVKLNPGQGVKLELEYEARFPGGENIIGV
ncbi:MAG: hypothetical protein Q9208_006473 [Pyrenodesmia sp. 3 TL-2023]